MANESQQAIWRERVSALKNLPQVMRLVWRAAPGVVGTGIAVRFMAAMIPLGILAVSKRIIDMVVNTTRTSGASIPHEIWILLAMEFVLAGGGLVLGRAIDYCDTRLADEFSRALSLRLMRHAA